MISGLIVVAAATGVALAVRGAGGPERHPMQIDSEYLEVRIREGRVVDASLTQG